MIVRIKKQLRDTGFCGFGFLVFTLAMGLTAVRCEATAAVDPNRGPDTSNFHFSLQVKGIINGYFTDAYNMGSETEVVSSKVSGQTVKRNPGKLKISEITLRRGLTSNQDLVNWRKMVTSGNSNGARKDGVLILLDNKSSEVARWNLLKAWPSEYTCPPAEKASTTGSAAPLRFEVIKLTVEGIERVK